MCKRQLRIPLHLDLGPDRHEIQVEPELCLFAGSVITELSDFVDVHRTINGQTLEPDPIETRTGNASLENCGKISENLATKEARSVRNLIDEFLLDPEIHFLNHGSFGAAPKPVFDRYQTWQAALESQPVQFFSSRIIPLLDEARGRLTLVGDPDLVVAPIKVNGSKSI